MTRLRLCRLPVPLISLQDRPEMYLDRSYALPRTGVAVPLIVADDFYERAREHSLPGCSVVFVTMAGSWSARNSRSGFVPSSMFADFTDDPDLTMRTLLAARYIERVTGGVLITEASGVTVVNASVAAAKAAEAEAEAEAERTAKSAGGKRGNHDRWHKKRGIRAPGCEYCETAPTAKPKRTSHGDRMRSGTESHATPRSRSKDLDLDSDLNPDQVSHPGVINAGTREDPAVIAAVIDAARARGELIGEPEAATAIARIRARPKTPKKITNPVKYFTAAIENEDDLYAELLDEPPPLAEIVAGIAADGAGSTEMHPYDPDSRTRACRCGLQRTNWRHEQQTEEARQA